MWCKANTKNAPKPSGAMNMGYDDICSLLECLSISTDELLASDAIQPRSLSTQMVVDDAIYTPPPPIPVAMGIGPPSNNTSGTQSSVEWYRQLLSATRDEVQVVLKRMRELEFSKETIQYPDLFGQIQNSQERAILSERLALLTHHQDALSEALYIEETMLYYGE
ncbi:uncharacterized protein EI90DRAFT_3126542 [Cantharellus anzutake]|uniref:uncharacterized protein n=1 Tax=Cantharellus anzutake TaxID=1750568 RepID=UPI001904E523|nr:uncharacterized protein EI90DRAFT_3126542 [Cantharellus anzutake]KAF8327883.1 hypothetical protein EI90DRAFT_3126542 [Cantharellus anzutake]